MYEFIGICLSICFFMFFMGWISAYIADRILLKPKRKRLSYNKVVKLPLQTLIEHGVVKIGQNVNVDDNVWIGHPEGSGAIRCIEIGDNCYFRTGTVIYSGCKIGNNVKTGQMAVVRENCTIGNDTQIGTLVTVENNTRIGSNCSIETLAHITGNMTIEDGVFVGGFVGSTNDLKMNWKRAGHGQGLQGATIKKNARIGSGAILFPRVVIGENSIINAGEIVRKDVADNTMYFTHKTKSVYKKQGGA
jgi:UDP-2-acetamido-3-amino-2,3-dideoxy-glucuronate N-acetyltransferase